MGSPIFVSLTLPVAAATGIAQAQSTGGAANLTLNGSLVSGGVATLSPAQRVGVASTGNNSGVSFTITGTGRGGSSLVETITGPNNSTVYTTQDFLTVTSIAASGATTGNVTAGTVGVGSTRWIGLSYQIAPAHVSVGCTVTGSVTYTVEYTYDTVANLPDGTTYAKVFPVTEMTGLTATADGNITFPVQACRATITAGTGTLDVAVLQAGIVGN